MADVTTFSELDALAVSENLTLLKEMLQSEFPSMDLSPGSNFYQVVLRAAALMRTADQTDWERRLTALSPADAAADPENADSDSVDRIASNWNITRREGTTAYGTALLIFSSTGYYPIPTSITFTSNGITFRPVKGYAAVEDESFVSDGDQLVLTARSDGTYSVAIQLQANDTGTAGNIGDGARFTVSPAWPELISAAALGDFSGGKDTESTADLVARLSAGISTPGSGNRAGISGLLKASFPQLTDVSVIGAGDTEMLRGGYTGLGIKAMGFADVYVRARPRASRVTVTKAAQLLDTATATWQITFDRDEYPGMYGVDRVYPVGFALAGTGSPLTFSCVRGTDTSAIAGVDFTPRMRGIESNFTRYQTMVVTFTDVDRGVDGLSVGDERDYQVDLVYMPDLAAISDWLLNRSRRPWGGDYLVKAAVPCMVSVSMRILRGLSDPDLASDETALGEIRAAVADAVNNVDFSEGRLGSGVVIDAAQRLLTGRTRVQTPIDLRGKLFLPDGTSAFLFSRDELVAPNRPEIMCTSRTVSFMCDPSQVVVQVVNNNAARV